MPGRSFTVALTDDQAAILDQLAADREADPAALLLDAIAHGLAMIAAGVDESDLREPWDRPGTNPDHRPARDFPRPEDERPADDLPF